MQGDLHSLEVLSRDLPQNRAYFDTGATQHSCCNVDLLSVGKAPYHKDYS
jgi:hypothetical protein